ncbi:PTS sugar transporter subunit IIA [Geobacter sp. DSM 9736]|uniref:PTS sugar transporter subunit IIA n=1 Tax=Geobacter sp. DSM 9736 TaxID=1277350 RepID=UPI000B50726C|nr:PTS sugar transporter subunit IIA [Geobacter sp. DSM 9736]SNB46420.1 PTS IIA-like nitrogen-regulatory protein PtsN [Geobacter sp. DSM 9736]
MKNSLVLQQEDVIAELAAGTKYEVLEELALRAVERHPGVDKTELLRVLQDRERLGSTGIGDGIAVPHGKLRHAREVLSVFGRSRSGIDFNALDGRKVHLFFLLVAPEEAVGIHLKMLARISRLLKDSTVRGRLLEAKDEASLFSIIRDQDSRF